MFLKHIDMNTLRTTSKSDVFKAYRYEYVKNYIKIQNLITQKNMQQNRKST